MASEWLPIDRTGVVNDTGMPGDELGIKRVTVVVHSENVVDMLRRGPPQEKVGHRHLPGLGRAPAAHFHARYGEHRAADFPYSDPLVVDAPVEWVLSEYAQWAEDGGTEWDPVRFTIDLAPDDHHKANVSGLEPYAMEVPNEAVDGILLGERHETTFVNYLRIAFSWAGFPGWETVGSNGSARPSVVAPTELAGLARTLLPL